MRSSRQVFSISRSFSAPSNTTHPFCCYLTRYVGKSSFATGMKMYPRSLAYIAAKAAIFLPDSAAMTTFPVLPAFCRGIPTFDCGTSSSTRVSRLANRRTNPFHRFYLHTLGISGIRHFRPCRDNNFPCSNLFEVFLNIFIRQCNVHLIRT